MIQDLHLQKEPVDVWSHRQAGEVIKHWEMDLQIAGFGLFVAYADCNEYIKYCQLNP